MYAYPMDSIVTYAEDGTPQFDRAVDSSQLRELHHSLMTDGVLLKDSSNLQVSASSNMEIVVNPGLCNIQGCIKKFSEDTIITIASANATMSRIDTVVARLDLNSDYRDIGLFVIQGTPASVPTRPELTRNTSVYEIALADITISANATSITQANISDTRLDTNRCGIISSITQFDTTKLYKQIEADLIEFQESNETEFEVWFEHMKEQLGEDAAGNLQLQIDDVNEKATEHIENTENPHDVTADQVSIDGYSANNVQGEIDEISRTLGYRVGKNYIRYPYDDMRVNITSYGVTYSVDSDGVVTLNGTSKEIGGFVLNNARTNPVKLKKGTYKLTGCGNGATETTFYLHVYTIDENSNGVILAKDFGEGAEFTLENDTLIGVQIYTTAIDVVFNNVVFKPMISKEGGDFEPPIADVQTQINNLQVLTLKSGAELLINGRMGILIFTGAVFSNFTGTEILIENSKYKPIRNTTSSVRAIVGGGYYADMMMSIKTDGTITLNYVPSQGATETKVPSTSTAVYGSIPYFING